jgi:ATP-dependent Lon protease
MEKIALKVVKDPNAKVNIYPKDLEDYIGTSKFTTNRIYDKTPSGVVVGLAYNEYGGSILYIEATRSSFKKDASGLLITGKLGEVMQESTRIASTYAKNFLNETMPDSDAARYLDNHSVHVHVPEGAVPKDGPSAGITLTTALISLSLGKPIA